MNPPIPPSPPAPPVPAPEKKGLSGLAWAGIGCGTIALMVLALAIGGGIFLFNKVKEYTANPEKMVAEMLVKSHPELETIATDDAKGEITVKTKSGEQFTVTYKDIAAGKFTFRDANGVETRLGGSKDIADVPAWVPRVPGMTGDVSVFNNFTGGKNSGIYVVQSGSSPQDIEDAFEAEASKLGMTRSKKSFMAVPGTTSDLYNLSYSDSTRRIDVSISHPKGQPATVTVTYQEL